MMKQLMICVLIVVWVAGTACSANAAEFDENSAEITNKYFPISAGKVLIYNLFTKEQEPTGMVNYWHCAGPDIVDGVKCLRVNRVTRLFSTEDAHYNALASDWYAQSTDGGVYLLQILRHHKPISEFVTYGTANAELHMGPEETMPAMLPVEDITLGATGLGTFEGCLKGEKDMFGTVYFAPDIGPVRHIMPDGSFNELIGWEFPLAPRTSRYDITGDGTTGLPEAIHALQVAAGMSETGMFTLSTDAFSGGAIPTEYACGDNAVSPPLSWANPPAGTKSFVLIMDNLDALPVEGHTLDHWLTYDIPASTTALSENAAANLPSGAKHGTNAEGTDGYLAACPPSGAPTTRYYFRLYALDIAALNPSHTSKIGIQAAMIGHVIGQTELVGTSSAK